MQQIIISGLCNSLDLAVEASCLTRMYGSVINIFETRNYEP